MARLISISARLPSKLRQLEQLNLDKMPVCIAKTQYSLSDNAKLLDDQLILPFMCDISVSSGAGFIVVMCGTIMKMPGLPKHPSAERIDVDDTGHITACFKY